MAYADAYVIGSDGVPRIDARARNQKLRSFRQILSELKAKTPCKDCKERFPPEAMDFDHISDDKCFNLSVIPARATGADVIAEIKKCEIVCSNCHRTRTTKRAAARKRLLRAFA